MSRSRRNRVERKSKEEGLNEKMYIFRLKCCFLKIEVLNTLYTDSLFEFFGISITSLYTLFLTTVTICDKIETFRRD